MVKLLAFLTLILAATAPMAQAKAVIKNGRGEQQELNVAKRAELYARDEWTFFFFFDWSPWTNWSFNGYNLQYVKDWYFYTYGYSTPPSVGFWDWSGLSAVVSSNGTPNVKAVKTAAYTDGGPNPWIKTSSAASSSSTKSSASPSSSSSVAASTSSSASKSTSASTSTSTSTSSSASTSKSTSASSSSNAVPSSSSSSIAPSSSSSSAAASSSSSASTSSSASSTSSKASSSSSAAASSSSSAASSTSSSASSSAASSSASSSASSTASSTSSTASSSSSTSSTAPAPTQTVPTIQGWMPYSGPNCIQEGTVGRALTAYSFSNAKMTVDMCTSTCDSKGLPIAGLEYSTECYCGAWLSNGATTSRQGLCTMSCGGNSLTNCGGSATLSIWVSTTASGQKLTPDLSRPNADVDLPAGWRAAAIPCIAESTKISRALDDYFWADDSMTIAMCLNFCATKNMPYAGLEYARECLCGDSIVGTASLSQLPTNSDCDMPCLGAPSQTCGGSNAIQLYKNNAYVATTINNYNSSGCIQEVGGRALRGAAYSGSDMTIQTCTSFCAARGFGIAGVEFGRECYCGNSLEGSATLQLKSTQCYMSCAGGDGNTCGGPNAINVYVNPNQVKATVVFPDGWGYRGCIAEGTSGRALMTQLYIAPSQNSPIACAKAAVAAGFQYAGVEYSTQCWASNSLSNGATFSTIDEGRCNYKCSGDGAQFCGGSGTLSLYAAGNAP